MEQKTGNGPMAEAVQSGAQAQGGKAVSEWKQAAKGQVEGAEVKSRAGRKDGTQEEGKVEETEAVDGVKKKGRKQQGVLSSGECGSWAK